MSDKAQKFRFKVTVIGDGMVGKTSLIKKFTQGSFKNDYIKTIGAQFSVYNEEIDGDKIKLLFWDIAGQDDFNFLRPSFYRDTAASIIVYTLEENELGRNSLKHIARWYEDLEQFCQDIPVVVFANKVDLVNENDLHESEIQEIIKEQNFLGYFKTSAKTGQGVIEAFNAIIDKLYRKYKALSTSL